MPIHTDSAVSGLTQPVRNALKKMVLDLRALLEDDYRKQLVALGIREGLVQPLPAGRTLSEPDQRTREVAIAVIEREVGGGASRAEAAETFVRDSAFTFLNRAVGLRCLEARGLLLVDGQPETVFTLDPARNASSLYWRVRNELPAATSPRDVWRETLRRAGEAVSQQVRVLFDPQSEFAALFPQQATVQKVAEALNAPEVPAAAYLQDEFVGWVYQYYNTREKQKVYDKLAKGGKIERPEELAAATCLYTERYMVDYLLQNTLGALWVEMHPDSQLPKQWPYYVQPPEGEPKVVRPAKPLRDVTLLDPAPGSGHFLVRAFDLLVAMYREEGREAEEEIPHLILERNLHGIDIDLRAVQLAALTLFLKGCALAGPGFRPRRLNLVPADVLLPGEEPPQAYLARFKGDRELVDLVKGIWRGLKNARTFGSLLHPERAVDEVVRRRREEDRRKYPLLQRDDVHWDRWKNDLLAGLQDEFEREAQSADLGQRLFGKEAAKGVSLVEALGIRYDVVVANPPYAGTGNLGDQMKSFISKDYKEGGRDLYSAFIVRCLDFCLANGYVGMVTQQGWMFQSSLGKLRQRALQKTTVTTLSHLGPRAFEEISGEVVNTVLFCVRAVPPAQNHRLVAFRLIGAGSPAEKSGLLLRSIAGSAPSIVFTPLQQRLLALPSSTFAYWLRPRFFDLLAQPPEGRIERQVFAAHGLGTRCDFMVVRFHWELSHRGSRWFPYSKGGKYARWYGCNWYEVDYANGGQVIAEYLNDRYPYLKGNLSRLIADRSYYFRDGLCYSEMGRGSLGVRVMPPNSIPGHRGPGLFVLEPDSRMALLAYLNSRLTTYMYRALVQSSLLLDYSYFHLLPALPSGHNALLLELGDFCLLQKRSAISHDPIERSFAGTQIERNCSLELKPLSLPDALEAVRLHIEGWIDRIVFDIFSLDKMDIKAVIEETGTPSGWLPLVSGYDSVPRVDLPPDTLERVTDDLAARSRRRLCSEELERLRSRLRAAVVADLGEAEVDGSAEYLEDDLPDDSLGGDIPVPSEASLEAIAQTLNVHPISVYWLLCEMSQHHGLVSPPEMKRHLEDYASVSILRLLGYRWPEQDAHEKEHGPILDPKLVDDDGIIPLVPCGNEPTAAQLLRARLERDFGEEGAAKSEQEFRQWVGRDLGEWLKKDFFKRHITQFKQRPIAWHLVSPERNFEAFVLYHKLSRATLQKLRAQYAGKLIDQFKAEQERARAKGDAARARTAVADRRRGGVPLPSGSDRARRRAEVPHPLPLAGRDGDRPPRPLRARHRRRREGEHPPLPGGRPAGGQRSHQEVVDSPARALARGESEER